MNKKMSGLMKALAKVAKSYADRNETSSPEESAKGMKKEINEFLEECGISNIGVDVVGISKEEAEELHRRAERMREEDKKEAEEGVAYFLMDTGTPVHIGDELLETLPCDGKTEKTRITITEDNIDHYIAKGVISKKKRGEFQVPMGVVHYIHKIAYKLNKNAEDLVEYFAMTAVHCPAAPISILLREIALTMDLQYKDNIKKCDRIFCISMIDGEVHEILSKEIKNFRTLAAFRTKEDAETAMEIVKVLLDDLFSSDKEYDKKHFPSRRQHSNE